MYWYNSRWYNASLGRWAQPDTIIPEPGDSMAWDRYAYVDNAPSKYVDPNRHNPILTGLFGLAVGGAVGGIV